MSASAHAANVPMPSGYEFVRVLGSGGCGTVALARQAGTGRLVAVKTLHAGRADDDERRRFEREGRALARLRDRRIVAVHAMAAMGDDLVLVIEYVDGTDLQDASERRRLDGAGTLRALVNTAAALDVAARGGVVHRDVKPANVLVARDGGAKLTDFGIARLVAAASAFRTGRAMPIGTPRYMAPEQIMDPERESAAGDAYSFGVMVFEQLLGRPPFPAADLPQLLYAHANLPPPAPRQLRPQLSAQTEAVLLAALAKAPGDRPAPGELMTELARRPDEWTHIVAAPAGAEVSAPAPPPVPVAPAESRVSATAGVPAVAATVYRPTPPRRSVPPAAMGAIVALAALAVLFVLLL